MSKSTIDKDTVIATLRGVNEAKCFVGTDGNYWVKLSENECSKSFDIESKQFAVWMFNYLRKSGWSASESLQEEIKNDLKGLCLETDEKRPVFLRIGKLEKDVGRTTIYIDRNDKDFTYVRISEEGVRELHKCPVAMFRSTKQSPLPEFKIVDRDVFLRKFKRWFAVDGDSWLLILAFVLKSLHRGNGSYVCLVFDGLQGCGKSTLSRRLKLLIDPAEPAFFSPPGNSNDIIVATVHSYLLVFDNVSGLSDSMADTLCRILTGGGISKKKNYTDHDEAFYNLHCPVILNGIEEPSVRADLQDRCVTIHLQRLRDEDRISEAQLNTDFSKDLPELLGGVYQLLSDCLKELPMVQTHGLPRMTDYARMGIAIERKLGLKRGTFLKAYEKNRADQRESAFENDEVCVAISRLLDDPGGPLYGGNSKGKSAVIKGTIGDLLKQMSSSKGLGRNSGHNRTPRWLSAKLKRIEPLLRERGILVTYLPKSARGKEIEIRRASIEDPMFDSRNNLGIV